MVIKLKSLESAGYNIMWHNCFSCGRMNLCEKTVTDDVIELVYLLSQNEFYNKEQISVLINGLLSLKILKVNKNLREIFFESIIQCFILKEGTDNLNPKIAEKIHLKCSLSEKVLRCVLHMT